MDICLFNKFGHCKFQGTCRKRHIMNICEKEDCEVRKCLKRHPRECSYYREFKRCKFGSYCSFVHKTSKNDQIKELKKELNDVKSRLEKIEDLLKFKSMEFELNETEIDDNQVKDSRIGEKDQKEEISKEFSQDIRNSESTSTNTKETEIDNTKIQISKPIEEKSSVSLHPKFKCYLCGESLQSISDLKIHHNRNHKGYPKKMVCEECDHICTHAAMLNNHKETEHNIYICARCNIQFNGKESLEEHTETQHT